MLKRLIPVLLIDRDLRLVKTENFKKRTYVGDPLNVVRLFNEMQVDEICILDIDARLFGAEPNYGFIAEFASECFMPLAYGGGIRDIKQAEALNKLGVEKFILGTEAMNISFVSQMVNKFGSQAVVGCIDHISQNVIKPDTNLKVGLCAKRMQDAGIGEIILQSIERDGARCGYCLDIIRSVTNSLDIPVIALGGARDSGDLEQALAAGASAAASGSAFTFVGDLRAVLINYPDYAEQLTISGHGV